MLKKGCGFVAVMCIVFIAGIVGILFVATHQTESTSQKMGLSHCKYHDLAYDANGDLMKIYVVDGERDFDEFRTLCIKFKKENQSQQKSCYLVLFDFPENAIFPSNPFSAGFGLSMEPMKHVLAWYEYNPMNDYSELQTFTKNMANSKAYSVRIE